MKFTIVINFRSFGPEERRDAGYFNGFSSKNRATIDVNSSDPFFEQILTLFHEVTHAIFDLATGYEKKGKRWKKRPADVREEWRLHESPSELEEQTCIKVEEAVKNTLENSIVSAFFTKLFGGK